LLVFDVPLVLFGKYVIFLSRYKLKIAEVIVRTGISARIAHPINSKKNALLLEPQ